MWAKDFKEFAELLNRHEVEYLLVGGYALGIHGHPCYTGDMDVWISPTSENTNQVGCGDAGTAPYPLENVDLPSTHTSIPRNRIMAIIGKIFFLLGSIFWLSGTVFQYLAKRELRSDVAYSWFERFWYVRSAPYSDLNTKGLNHAKVSRFLFAIGAPFLIVSFFLLFLL